MRLPLSVRYPPLPITARPSPRQIETLASSLEASGSTANIARLGIWGELYLVPLAGAKAILCRYCQSGMLLGSDNQLRMLSGPECASPPADFPPPIGSPYKLRAQPGAGHNHDRDVTRRAARLGGVGNHTVWLGTISRQFQERARVEMKRFPAQPRWCRRLGSSCRFGVPLDNISQRLYDGWRVGTCEQHTRQRHPEHFSCSEEAKGLTSPPASSATPALWAPFAPRWAASRHGARALSVSRVAPSSGAERPAAAPGARLGEYLWRFLLPFMGLLPGEVRRGEE